MKKAVISILSVLFAVSLSIAGIACSDKKETVINDNRKVILSSYELIIEKDSVEKITAEMSVGKGKFVWSTSDEAVATVEEGVITGVSVGTAVVTAKYGDKQAECKVSVVLPDGYPKFYRGDEEVETFVGNTYKIDAKVTFNGEEVQSAISYEVANERIATVDNGVITGVSEGETEIKVTAVYCGYAVVKTVSVKVHGRMIVRADNENAVVQLVEDSSLGYKTNAYIGVKAFYDLNDVTGSVTDVVWTSSDDKIVAVTSSADENGFKRAEVSSVSAGDAKIKCDFKYNGESYSYSFDVVAEKSVYTISEAVLADSETDGTQTATLTTNIPSGCSVTPALGVKISGKNAEIKEIVDNDIVLARPNGVAKGGIDVTIEDAKWICTVEDGVYCTAVLTNDSCEVLKDGGELFSGDYYVLGEDINVGWTSKTMEPVKIMGTLDGRGHTLKGITLDKPASGWFRDSGDSSQTYVGYISVNDGVIKNLAIEYEATTGMEDGSNTFSDLIHYNNGEINNLYIKADVKGSGWYGSVVVGKNYGVIRNCVTVCPEYKSSANLRARLSAYVAFSYGGSIINCYTLGGDWDGLNDSTAQGAGKCYTEVYNGGVTISNWRGLSDLGEVASNGFKKEDGWSGFWRTDKYIVAFAGEQISLIPTTYLELDYIEESEGSIAIEVPSEVTLDGMTITFNGKKATPVSLEEGILTVKRGSFVYGEYDIAISYADRAFKAMGVSFVTKAIRSSDADNFADLFVGDEDAYFVLAEDIDFGGKGLAGNINLKGVFDGKGHTLKNFVLDYTGYPSNGWNAYIFSENNGTIKNVAFEYDMKDSPNDRIAIVNSNKGVIENVYAKVRVIETIQNDYQKAGALVQENKGGVIRNCITEITVEDGVIIGKDAPGSAYYTVAGITWYNLDGSTVENCYSVVGNSVIPLYAYSDSSDVIDSDTLGSVEDFSSIGFDKDNGWNEFWQFVDGEIIFGL